MADACGVFAPDTLLKWHRSLIAGKYDGSKKRTGGRKKISEVSIHYATRKVEVVGIIQQAHARWMCQTARNLVARAVSPVPDDLLRPC